MMEMMENIPGGAVDLPGIPFDSHGIYQPIKGDKGLKGDTGARGLTGKGIDSLPGSLSFNDTKGTVTLDASIVRRLIEMVSDKYPQDFL